MKTITIDEFRNRVESWSSDLEDVNATTGDMQLSDWDLEFTPKGDADDLAGSLFKSVGPVSRPYDAFMLDHARSQLASKLGIPSRWIQDTEKCPVPLRETVFNWKFLNEEASDLFLRLKSGDLRAVLSDQYTPFDHADLFGAVYRALEMENMLGHVEVAKGYIDDVMSAYILFKDVQFDGQDPGRMGDGGGTGGLRPAVYISNSEIGTGSSRIHGGLYRSFCNNGVILGWNADTTFRIVHRFRSREQVALLANEAIAESMKLSEEAAIEFIEAQHNFVNPQSLKSITGKWSRKYGLTVSQSENWLERVVNLKSRHGRVSYADVINEATYMAHNTEDRDQIQTLERMAGEMVFAELPANQYDERFIAA